MGFKLLFAILYESNPFHYTQKFYQVSRKHSFKSRRKNEQNVKGTVESATIDILLIYERISELILYSSYKGTMNCYKEIMGWDKDHYK